MIKVYEAKESLESMILGINKDPKRVMFDAMVALVDGAQISREFVDSGVVPRFEVAGEMHEMGHYPCARKLATWLDVDVHLFDSVDHRSELLDEAQTTRLGACCGVGMDVYLDPNED